MPTEADGVIGVTSVGPSGRKAYYSDYGLEQADVSAPGGDSRDTPDGSRKIENTILAAYPYGVGVEDRGDGKPDIDPVTGEPTTPAVIKQGGAYYQYIQGTSMASPHAVGVAALIVAEYGKRDKRNGGVTLDPAAGRADPQADRDRPRLPARRRADVPRRAVPPGPDYTATLRRHTAAQRVLRRRHRRRPRRGQRPPLGSPNSGLHSSKPASTTSVRRRQCSRVRRRRVAVTGSSPPAGIGSVPSAR